MIEFIDLIDAKGPLPLPQVLRTMKITHQQFKAARYSHPGDLAFEDRGVVIPRPVSGEKYVYKLVETYRTGLDDDAEPPFQMAFADILTRQASIYMDVEQVLDHLAPKTTEKKLLRKVKNALVSVLENMDSCVTSTATPVSPRAQYVLDNL